MSERKVMRYIKLVQRSARLNARYERLRDQVRKLQHQAEDAYSTMLAYRLRLTGAELAAAQRRLAEQTPRSPANDS
jgi:hypothetical protein